MYSHLETTTHRKWGTDLLQARTLRVIDASNAPDAAALRFMAAHWLSEYEYAPAALRRLMLEQQDELERRFRIQTTWLNR